MGASAMSTRAKPKPAQTHEQTAADLLAYPHDKPLVHVDRSGLNLGPVRAEPCNGHMIFSSKEMRDDSGSDDEEEAPTQG